MGKSICLYPCTKGLQPRSLLALASFTCLINIPQLMTYVVILQTALSMSNAGVVHFQSFPFVGLVNDSVTGVFCIWDLLYPLA